MTRLPPAPLVGLVLVIFVMATAFAADAPSWSGAWRISNASADASAREKAIETATTDLSRFKRGAARSRLGKRLTPPKQIELKLNGANVEITRDGESMLLPVDGTLKSVETDNGPAKVKAEQKGSQLVVTAASDNGTRTTVYERKGDTLTMSVELKAKMLSTPIRVSSTYSK